MDRGIVSLAVRDLERVWASLPLSDPPQARNALLGAVPQITTTYGEVAAGVAADRFDELRESAGVGGVSPVVMADPMPEQWVRKQVRFGAKHLFGPSPEQTLAFLKVAVSKYALRPSRETMIFSTERDGARWARVPTGLENCDFCLMLSSRGFVYRSEESGGAASFHGRCDCTVVPDWSQFPTLTGYDPDALLVQWRASVAAKATPAGG